MDANSRPNEKVVFAGSSRFALDNNNNNNVKSRNKKAANIMNNNNSVDSPNKDNDEADGINNVNSGNSNSNSNDSNNSSSLSETDLLGLDFGILLSCDHLIISYSTLGMWAGHLNLGTKVMALGLEGYEESVKKADFPNWHFFTDD